MKRSSLAWYVAVACLGSSLCVGSVVQADSPTTVKASSIVPTTVTTQVQSAQPVNTTVAKNTVANNVASNNGVSNGAVVNDAATQTEQAALKQK